MKFVRLLSEYWLSILLIAWGVVTALNSGGAFFILLGLAYLIIDIILKKYK